MKLAEGAFAGVDVKPWARVGDVLWLLLRATNSGVCWRGGAADMSGNTRVWHWEPWHWEPWREGK